MEYVNAGIPINADSPQKIILLFIKIILVKLGFIQIIHVNFAIKKKSNVKATEIKKPLS
jgi:hypothetical protein